MPTPMPMPIFSGVSKLPEGGAVVVLALEGADEVGSVSLAVVLFVVIFELGVELVLLSVRVVELVLLSVCVKLNQLLRVSPVVAPVS